MDSIVCAIDLSASTRPVIDWASMIARRQKARLCLFHAIHTPSDSLHPSAEFERGGELRRRRIERRSAIERMMGDIDVPWRAEIVFGEPVEAIGRLCRTKGADLVIAGKRGIKGFKRLMYGTVVERMARVVACPLMVLHTGAISRIRVDRIGICCDLSTDTPQLMALGFDFARMFDAGVHLLHAMATPISPTGTEPAHASYPEAQTWMETQIRDRMRAMVPSNEPNGIAIHLVRGEPKDTIPELAARSSIDLLIVGVRRHGALSKWVIGSTTEAVLRKADSHVMSVPLYHD